MASPNLSEIVTTTLNNYSRQIADNVTNHNALLRRLQQRGNVRTAAGGVKILQELDYAENSTFQWYDGYQQLDVSASDVLTAAEFEWKQANANVVISGREQMQNADSRERVHNLLRSRITNAERTMRNNIAAALYADGTGSNGKEIGGLQHLVADDPTTGTVGGINRSSNSFWRNQTYDFSDNGVTASESTIQDAMNDLWLQCIRGTDRPDLIVADNNFFKYYWASLQAQQRFQSNEMGEAGFMNVKFMDADVIYDDQAPTDRMYFLNTDFIFFRPHSRRNFVSLEDRMSVNQDAIVSPIVWMGNMTMSNASLQGVMKP